MNLTMFRNKFSVLSESIPFKMLRQMYRLTNLRFNNIGQS